MKTITKYTVKLERTHEGISIFKNEKGEDVVIQTEILPQNAGYYATQRGTVTNVPQAKWRRKVNYENDQWIFDDTQEPLGLCECVVNFTKEVGYNYVDLPVIKTGFRGDVDVIEGDIIYFHHHVADEANMTEEDTYLCEYRQIFGRTRDNVFTPVEDWVFCEPIPYEGNTRDSGLLIPHLISGMTQKGFEGQIIGKWHPSEAIVKYVPPVYKGELQAGDRIAFIKNADYDMKVEGEILFRINADHIMYVV